MNFKKDLLLIDIEASGLDPKRHEILQLAGILLDKRTLKEKQSFVSYIKPRHWQRSDPQSLKVNRITYDLVRNAPLLPAVLKKFNRTFGKQVILTYYVGIMDIAFLNAAYERARIKFPFDYHTFNIWGLFYSFLALKNKLNSKKEYAGFGLEDCLRMFKIDVPPNLHDALVDCRAEAEVLRKVLLELKK